MFGSFCCAVLFELLMGMDQCVKIYRNGVRIVNYSYSRNLEGLLVYLTLSLESIFFEFQTNSYAKVAKVFMSHQNLLLR